VKRFHIALGAADVDATVADYTRRLGAAPVVHVPGEYALWRNEGLNLSLRRAPEHPGLLRHLGWETPEAESFTTSTDVNGILWERFSAEQQAGEIEAFWPGTGYRPA
jgi:catechol 2,3-dioxygenase-like lactoylglutathione lyase family enzyme